MPIYWSQFDWQSFATLVTGLAAVGGALIIGLRQMKITERQNAVAEMALKQELYDRRFAVYAEILNSLEAITDLSKIGEMHLEAEKKIRSNAETSRFLFSERVFRRINIIAKRVQAYNYYALGCRLQIGSTVGQSFNQQEMMNHLKKLDLHRKNLYKIFYRDLKLDHTFHDI